MFVRGAGLGAALVPVMAACYQGLRTAEYPGATSAVRIFQQVGGSLGTAALAVILQQQTTTAPAGTAGLATAFGDTFWWAVGFSVVVLLPALLLPASPPTAGADEAARV